MRSSRNNVPAAAAALAAPEEDKSVNIFPLIRAVEGGEVVKVKNALDSFSGSAKEFIDAVEAIGNAAYDLMVKKMLLEFMWAHPAFLARKKEVEHLFSLKMNSEPTLSVEQALLDFNKKARSAEDFFNLVIEVSMNKKKLEELYEFVVEHPEVMGESKALYVYTEKGERIHITPLHVAAINEHVPLLGYLLSLELDLTKRLKTARSGVAVTVGRDAVSINTFLFKPYEKRYPQTKEFLQSIARFFGCSVVEITIKRQSVFLFLKALNHALENASNEKVKITDLKPFDIGSFVALVKLCESDHPREDFFLMGIHFSDNISPLFFSQVVWAFQEIFKKYPVSLEKKCYFLLGFLEGMVRSLIDNVITQDSAADFFFKVDELDISLVMQEMLLAATPDQRSLLIMDFEMLGFSETLIGLVTPKNTFSERLEKYKILYKERFELYTNQTYPSMKPGEKLKKCERFLKLILKHHRSYVNSLEEQSRVRAQEEKQKAKESLKDQESKNEDVNQVAIIKAKLAEMLGNSNPLLDALAIKLDKWCAEVKDNEVHVPLGQLFPRRRAHIEMGKMFILDRGELTALLKDGSKDLSEELKKRADFLHFKSRQQQQGAVAGAAAAAAAPAAAEEKKPDPNEVLEEATVNEWYKLDFYLWYLKIKATFRFTSSAADHQALCKSLQYLYNAWVRIDRAKSDPLWKYELPSLKEANNLKTHAEKLLSRAPAGLLLFGQAMREKGGQLSQRKEVSKMGLKNK